MLQSMLLTPVSQASTMALQNVCLCVCVYAAHAVRALYTRSQVNAYAAVKRCWLLLLQVLLGCEPSIVEMPQERLCRGVLD